ncbi:MAG: hypothetical protein ACRDVE_17975 [Actinocrinis sp.]
MRQVAVIAVAVAVIVAVVLLTGGVVAGSNVPDTLEFFGVSVHTTSAQVFLTGAICTWALLAAAWLLSAGIRRSRARGMQLASSREHAAGDHDGVEASAGPPVRPLDLGNTGELAGLFGFATRSATAAVTDRPGARGGVNRSETGQDAAEQPPRGQ